MAIDFMEGLTSTVNDALNPLFELARQLAVALNSIFQHPAEHSSLQEHKEPFR